MFNFQRARPRIVLNTPRHRGGASGATVFATPGRATSLNIHRYWAGHHERRRLADRPSVMPRHNHAAINRDTSMLGGVLARVCETDHGFEGVHANEVSVRKRRGWHETYTPTMPAGSIKSASPPGPWEAACNAG